MPQAFEVAAPNGGGGLDLNANDLAQAIFQCKVHLNTGAGPVGHKLSRSSSPAKMFAKLSVNGGLVQCTTYMRRAINCARRSLGL